MEIFESIIRNQALGIKGVDSCVDIKDYHSRVCCYGEAVLSFPW
jgi:hypothetical protein